MEIEAEQSVELPNSDESLETGEESQDVVIETQSEEDQEDFDIDGYAVKLPKSKAEWLRNNQLMQADYTRKTQEVAENRKQIEARAQSVAEAEKLAFGLTEHRAELHSVQKELAEFQKLSQADWNALSDKDPVMAQKAIIKLQQLQARDAQLRGAIAQSEYISKERAQRETAKRVAEGNAVLQRDIKGWSPEVASKVMSYGKDSGFPEEVLSQVTEPAFVKVLHKAYLYDQLAKQRTKPPEQPAPATRIASSNAKVSKSLSDMSMDEFTKARQAYIRKNR